MSGSLAIVTEHFGIGSSRFRAFPGHVSGLLAIVALHSCSFIGTVPRQMSGFTAIVAIHIGEFVRTVPVEMADFLASKTFHLRGILVGSSDIILVGSKIDRFVIFRTFPGHVSKFVALSAFNSARSSLVFFSTTVVFSSSSSESSEDSECFRFFVDSSSSSTLVALKCSKISTIVVEVFVFFTSGLNLASLQNLATTLSEQLAFKWAKTKDSTETAILSVVIHVFGCFVLILNACTFNTCYLTEVFSEEVTQPFVYCYYRWNFRNIFKLESRNLTKKIYRRNFWCGNSLFFGTLRIAWLEFVAH
jgi:hypothetical protein